MKYEIYKSKGKKSAGQLRWRLRAQNGRILANSGESYHNRADLEAAIALVRASGDVPVVEK
jgi:uncharacterized protein YegP (UPF0339 family)